MKRRGMNILVAVALLAGIVLLAIKIGPCATPSEYYTDFPIRDNERDPGR